MSNISRRKLITTGLVATAGAAGIATAAHLTRRYGLIPPDNDGFFGPGETLTYAAQRILTRHSLAREFPRSMISEKPFGNEVAPPSEAFKRHQATGFSDWKVSVDGMVAHPASFSISDLKALPAHNQITEVVCEEGWSYVAEWIGTPLVMCSMPSASCHRRATSSTSPSSPTGGKASTWPTPRILKLS